MTRLPVRSHDDGEKEWPVGSAIVAVDLEDRGLKRQVPVLSYFK